MPLQSPTEFTVAQNSWIRGGLVHRGNMGMVNISERTLSNFLDYEDDRQRNVFSDLEYYVNVTLQSSSISLFRHASCLVYLARLIECYMPI